MRQTVILVEDEELINTMVSINLEQEGLRVLSFSAAEPMLEHLQANPAEADIILLDIVLPGISGEEAIPQIRALTARTPILMLTAKRDLETRVGTLNSGADDFLAKPFNVQELVARVHALLRRSQSAGPEGQKE